MALGPIALRAKSSAEKKKGNTVQKKSSIRFGTAVKVKGGELWQFRLNFEDEKWPTEEWGRNEKSRRRGCLEAHIRGREGLCVRGLTGHCGLRYKRKMEGPSKSKRHAARESKSVKRRES